MTARVSRVTQLSANQVMFGAALNDLDDLHLTPRKLDELKQEKQWKESEVQYLQRLQNQLKLFKKNAIKNRDKYIEIMAQNYDWKYHKTDIKYERGELVLYFVGDQNHTMQKIREKWTSPG